MTPRQRLVAASADEALDTARLKLHAHRIEKLPLVDNQDRVVGLITVQDIIKLQEHPQATKDSKGRLRVGVAIGVRLDEAPDWFLERFSSADLIVAKGMANWETLTETPAPCPLLYVFRTKCEPVARAVRVPEMQNVALLVERGWSLSPSAP